MPGARCTRGRVQCVHRNAHTSIQVQSEHSGIPAARARAGEPTPGRYVARGLASKALSALG
jgi:hypothetical protein